MHRVGACRRIAIPILLTAVGVAMPLAAAPSHAAVAPARPARLTVPTCRGMETFDLNDAALLQAERAAARLRGERAELLRDRALARGLPSTDDATTLTSTVIVRCRDRDKLDALLAPHAMRSARADAGTGELPNFYTLRCASLADAAALASELHALVNTPDLGLDEVYLDTQPAWALRAVPTDPGLAQQWHLINTITSPAYDINADAAWNLGATGAGVTVGVVETGYDATHPDLAANFNTTASQTLAGTTSHGTSVAGLVAADDNAIGGVGVAFNAKHARLYIGAAQANADAFLFRNDLNAVKTNSWGPTDSGLVAFNSSMERSAILSAVTSGRGGLGTVFVWAAGNGSGNNDRVDYDPYASSRYTISVGAIDADDHHSVYSEPGSSLMLVAPSDSTLATTTDTGIYTTSGSTEYTSVFGGTSAAAPIAAGAVALVLSANPNLTWRDVQHVLIDSARTCDPTSPGWSLNAGGRWFNESYGFGAIDAGAAVALAQSWTNVAAEQTATATYTPPASILIPDAPAFPPFSPVVTSVAIAESLRVESVELTLSVAHARIGDLRVELVSPSGTVSTLAAPRADPTDNYVDYLFTSLRSWDEPSNGTWTLRITDETMSNIGSLVNWSLAVHGTPLPPTCPCDFNGVNGVTVQDIFDFLTAWLAGNASADFNHAHGVTVQDIFDFLTCWLAGC